MDSHEDHDLARAFATSFVSILALAILTACTKDKSTSAPDASPVASTPPPPPPSAIASESSTAPIAIGPTRTLTTANLPKDIPIPGTLSKALAWTDSNGENVVAFVIRWVGTVEDHDALKNVYLTVQHVAYPHGVKKVLRTVQDSRESCDDAMMKAAFLDDATSVTDLDGNGLGEITFAYRITCQGHHIPFTQKLVVLENGDKYILRSTSPSTYETDPSFDAGPSPFLAHAQARWRLIAR